MHDALEERAGNTLSHAPLMERYTTEARRAIQFARQESLHRGAAAVTIADLLAGLGVDEESRAERIGSLKANAFYLRWLTGLPALPARAEDSAGISFEDSIGCPGRNTGDPIGEWMGESRLKLDAEASRALGFAVVEADRDREYWIDSDHLLRGILSFPNRGHFAVLKTELNLHSTRVASKADRHKFPPHQTPSVKVVKYLIRKHLALWGPPIIGLACYLYILIQGTGLTTLLQAR
jgi:hypothetical protein